MTGYISPYGKPRGLVARLLKMAQTMATDRGRWAGLGIIEDLKLAASILNRREWLEAMRFSADPLAQTFAAELLDDVDELDCVETAAAHVQGLPDEPEALPGVETIERLDKRAQDYESVRAVLLEIGALAEGDRETPVADLVRALLS